MFAFIKKHWKGFLIGFSVVLAFIGGLFARGGKSVPGADAIKQLDKSNAGLASAANSAVGQLKVTNAEIGASSAIMDRLAGSSDRLVDQSKKLIDEANGGPAKSN